jgi:hypothetical protein
VKEDFLVAAGDAVGLLERSDGRFLQLHHFLMDCPAWRSLLPSDKAVYIALAALYDGTNNGRLAFSVRRAAEAANLNKDTAAKALSRLAERGFIEIVKEGHYHIKVRHSSEWRLTAHRCDVTKQPGSRAFLRWHTENSEDDDD